MICPHFYVYAIFQLKKKKSTFESTPRTTHFLSRPCSCSRAWSYCSLNISTRHLPNTGTVFLILRGVPSPALGRDISSHVGNVQPQLESQTEPLEASLRVVLSSLGHVPCDTQPGCPCPPLSDSPAPGSPPWAAPAPPATPRGSHGAHLLFPLQGP